MKVEERFDLAGKVLPRDYRSPAIDMIVIHRNTVAKVWRAQHPEWEGDDATATALWHRSPAAAIDRQRKFPYHFFVNKDGTAYHILPYNVIGGHAKGRNLRSVGVAMCHDGQHSRPSDAVLRGVAACIAKVRRDTVNEACPIEGHDLLKQCPGAFVPLDELERLSHEFSG